jgi:hypothetical protein
MRASLAFGSLRAALRAACGAAGRLLLAAWARLILLRIRGSATGVFQ